MNSREEPQLTKIDGMLQELLNRAAIPPVPPPPTEPGTEEGSYELLSGILREHLKLFFRGRENHFLQSISLHPFVPAIKKTSSPIFSTLNRNRLTPAPVYMLQPDRV